MSSMYRVSARIGFILCSAWGAGLQSGFHDRVGTISQMARGFCKLGHKSSRERHRGALPESAFTESALDHTRRTGAALDQAATMFRPFSQSRSSELHRDVLREDFV